MNPASIDGSIFTITGAGSAAVTGVVTYDASSDPAIFTPASSLALSPKYTDSSVGICPNMLPPFHKRWIQPPSTPQPSRLRPV